MKVQIAKWGKSLAIRLPKSIADAADLREGQLVDVGTRQGIVELRPVAGVKRYSLAELINEMDRLGPENAPFPVDWTDLPLEWPPYGGPVPSDGT